MGKKKLLFQRSGNQALSKIEVVGYQQNNYKNITNAGSGGRGMIISPDGMIFNGCSYNDGDFTTSVLNAPFDIQSTPLSRTVETSIAGSTYALSCNPDGTILHISPTGYFFRQVRVTNPYYQTPNSGAETLYYTEAPTYNMGTYFNGDGTKMFVSRRGTICDRWGLSAPYDITTATIDSYSSAGKFTNSRGFNFISNGVNFISYNFNTQEIELWVCPTPYDAFNAVLISTFNVTQLGVNPSVENLAFCNMAYNDYDYLFVHTANDGKIYRFDLKLT